MQSMSTRLPGTAVGRLLAAPPLTELADTLSAARAVSVSGLWGSSVAATLAAVGAHLRRPMLLICGHLDEADELADDLHLFTGKRPEVLPALELSGGVGRTSEEQVSNRLQLVARYASGGADGLSGRADSRADAVGARQVGAGSM